MTDYTLNSTDDLIDVRDMIARLEELETETNDAGETLTRDGEAITRDEQTDEQLEAAAEAGDEDAGEYLALRKILAELCGMGGDEQWRGDWYPITLIRDTHFEDYAQELAEECGLIPDNQRWPCTCIDWTQAARELQYDYSSIEIDNVTYWTR